MTDTIKISPEALAHAADHAARAIPPAWPLASSVAVNPYLGQTEASLAETGALLGRVSGTPVTMPRDWYAKRIADGTITDDDLAGALAASAEKVIPSGIEALKSASQTARPPASSLPSVAQLAESVSGTDWPGIVADRLGHWAAGYFDEGQALWAAPKDKSAYAVWREAAIHDLTPEILGLNGFAQFVSETPQDADAALKMALEALGMPEGGINGYFHALLLDVGGWAQYARYRLWTAELAGEDDRTITDLLTIRLLWEAALFRQYGTEIADGWADVCASHAAPVAPSADDVIDAILQDASDRAAQRGLASQFAAPSQSPDEVRPALQAAFCIDVRSEVFRRALESVDPGIRTKGFAGFFGLTAAHRGFASDVVELRLPVLLNPAVTTVSGDETQAEDDQNTRFQARALRAWGRFKLAAVSSFAFVEATGPIYAGKLVRDALGLAPNAMPDEPAPRIDPGLALEDRTGAAETVLRAMSMTDGFARLVLLAGHGANVVNNPHASGLHCGACGGYSGEVNARLLASLLNDPGVRAGLVPKGIEIPADTVFLGALHDTTTDAVHIYDADHAVPDHGADIAQARKWLASAGRIARAERALRLPHADGEGGIDLRSRDWSEVRPEWALAGCKAFVAAPRYRTSGKDFEGRAFLHDYDWSRDKGFGVLELIMTAPVVVASWISLQYYGSTVAPGLFGAGNKLLHNVTGGIGVLEGNGGTMRAGLPIQSVHDGADFVHEPVRLSVCIEAPREAMNDILSRHPGVAALFDNRWLHLFALDENGRMAWRYEGDRTWSEMPADAIPSDRLAMAG